jgi:hypothetical protein
MIANVAPSHSTFASFVRLDGAHYETRWRIQKRRRRERGRRASVVQTIDCRGVETTASPPPTAHITYVHVPCCPCTERVRCGDGNRPCSHPTIPTRTHTRRRADSPILHTAPSTHPTQRIARECEAPSGTRRPTRWAKRNVREIALRSVCNFICSRDCTLKDRQQGSL